MAAEHAEGLVFAEVVTTPEACGGLLKSLDETESTLVTLLQEIKWPGEVNLDRAAPVIKPPEAGNQ